LGDPFQAGETDRIAAGLAAAPPPVPVGASTVRVRLYDLATTGRRTLSQTVRLLLESVLDTQRPHPCE
jgi:hypothetical protein